MAYERPSWREIDKMKDQSGGRRKRERRADDAIQEHSTRYDKYKSELHRLFDQGMTGELLKKLGKESKSPDPAAAQPSPTQPAKAKDANSRRAGRISQQSDASASRLKLMRAVIDASDQASLIHALDDLVSRFGLPDDWEVLMRALEHPDEKLVLSAINKLRSLAAVTAKISRRFTLKERLRAIAQTAKKQALCEAASELENRI
jgi:hypothetical protein